MATMAGIPQSAAQLMFLPFFNGSPLTSLPPITSNGANCQTSANIEKFSQINPNHNSIFSTTNMTSHSSSSIHLREAKRDNSESLQNSVNIQNIQNIHNSDDDNCGANAPLNLSKPKSRANNSLSSSASLDISTRITHESPITQSLPLTPHETIPSTMFAENAYWNALQLPSHLRKNPFSPMAMHSSGLELVPPIDSLNMYLSNNNGPPMIVPDGSHLKKDNNNYHSADHTERKSDSVITCQSRSHHKFHKFY
jgi:hypothetical protein